MAVTNDWPLLPLLKAYQLVQLLGRHPRKAHIHTAHIWMWYGESLLHLLSTIFRSSKWSRKPHLQRVWHARLANNWEAEISAVYGTMGRKGERSCMRNSVIWPPRSIILAQKWSQKQSTDSLKMYKISGGHSPDPPSCYLLTHALPLVPGPPEIWWLQLCNWRTVVVDILSVFVQL